VDDGLNDGRELNTVKSNPFWADTDGDGRADGAEVDGINHLYFLVRVSEILRWAWNRRA